MVTSGGADGTVTADGILTGVAAGSVSVTATVDGVTSVATTVQIVGEATPSISVDWPARSRNLQGPSSALSVKMILHSPTGANPDVEIDGNRSSSLAAHTDTFSYPGQAAVGAYTLSATFYSQASLAGIVTATAAANVAISSSGAVTNPDGSPLSPISFTGAVKNVTITAGQSVSVGGSVQLTVSATDANGNVLAISPGSFEFVLTAGGSDATITPDGIITGVATGSVSVTAAADGVTSPTATVQVVIPADFANPSFETPQISTNSWVREPTDNQWSGTFTNGQNDWGVANGSGSWGMGAHTGTQYAFVQAGASMSQTITGLTVGQSYKVTFWCATRSGDVGANYPCNMTVAANGTMIYGPFEPPGDGSWNQYTTSSFTATSTSYTFVFQTITPGYDSSDLLDDVHLTAG